MANKTIPFDFIQCSSEYIEKIRLEEENKIVKIKNEEKYDPTTGIQEGPLYFVLDTKQILLGKVIQQFDEEVKKEIPVGTLVPMGSGTGVRFAKKEKIGNNLNPRVNFVLSDLEDQSCYPQIDDLIFNSDGCFYRVANIDGETIITDRLTVAGSGGGGSAGGTSGGGLVGSSQSVSYRFPKTDTTTIPDCVVYKSEGSFTAMNYIEFKLDGVKYTNEDSLKQTIYIDGKKVDECWITPWEDNIITFKNSWFATEATNAIQISYRYGSTQPYTIDLYPKGVKAIDLSINENKFKNTNIKETIVNNTLKYEGNVTDVLPESDYDQRIYIKISPLNSNDYVPIKIYGFTEAENGYYYFQVTNKSFSTSIANLPYGMYTFKSYQVVNVKSGKKEQLIGTENTYYFTVGDNSENPNQTDILFLCDLTSVDDKVFKDIDEISVPMMIHIPGKNNYKKGVKITTQYEVGNQIKNSVINSDENITFSLRRLPVCLDDNGKEQSYTIKIYLTDYPEISYTCTITVMKTVSIDSDVVEWLELTAENRNNTEVSRHIWENVSVSNSSVEDAYGELTNFTWVNGGTGWNSQALQLKGDAKVTIKNFNAFAATDNTNSIPAAGRTLLFHFNVTNFAERSDFDNPVIKCISKVTGGEFGLKVYGDAIEFVNPSMIGGLRMGYMNGEEIHLGVCISPINQDDIAGTVNNSSTSKRGLVEIYVNGILSAARLYREQDFPQDLSDFEFTIGNEKAAIDIYSINVFQGKLSSKEIVKYYLSSLKDLNKAAELKVQNDIYDGDKLSVQKIKDNTSVPVMILKGELPEQKTDKLKTVAIEFYHPTDIEKSFNVGIPFPDPKSATYEEDLKTLIPIEVQGTSSQYYPVKNWKLKKLKVEGADGKKSNYQIDKEQIATGTYCLKADYAEATGTHNTQNANFIDSLYRTTALGSCKKSIAQIRNDKTRTTIYGYPIIVFHQRTAESDIEFLGKYNFNFDKGSKEVFGFEQTFEDPETQEKYTIPVGECWEFCNNDDITGIKYGAFDTIRADKNAKFAWNKWKVTYYSNRAAGTIREVYFPMDQEFVNNFPEEYESFKDIFTPPADGGISYVPEGMTKENISSKCNSNYDYIKSLIYKYIDMMKQPPISKEKLYNEALLTGDEELIAKKKKQYDDALEEVEWWKQAECSIDTIIPMWMEFFEARFCDRPLYDANGNVITYRSGTGLDENNQAVAEYDDIYDISNFAKLYDWILSTGAPASENINDIPHPWESDKTKGDIFERDLSKYFDVQALQFYYLYTHFAVMADQRAKNMFFTYWYPMDENYKIIPEVDENGNDIPREEIISKAKYGGYWIPWFYDNDTCFGINNTGYESFGYASEDDASDADSKVYQGEESVLWRNLKLKFEGKIQELYSNLRASSLNLENLQKYFIEESAEKWPLAIYNEDAQAKYIKYAYKTILLSNNANDTTAEREEVIGNIRGNGASRFKRFMTDRLDYCDMRWKNVAGKPVLQIRPMNAEGFSGDYKFKPFTTGFYGLYFGAYGASAPNYFTKKARQNTESIQTITTSSGSNNVTYMIPPSHFLDLGDLSKFNLREFMGPVTKLEVLQLGNKDNVPKYCEEIDGEYYNITGNIFNYVKEKISANQLNTDFDNFNVEQVNRMRNLKAAVKEAENRGYLQEKPNSLDSYTENCPSLKYVDISNIGFDTANQEDSVNESKIITSLSFSGSPNLRKVYARNARINNLLFSEGGYLEELLLPDYLKSFKIQKQILLKEENVIFENCLFSDRNPYRNLEAIIIEDCDQFDSKTFLLKCLDRRSDITNYNVADKFLETGVPIEKIIRITNVDYEKEEDGKTPKVIKTVNGKNVYSSWVFKDNDEFKTFVENLEYLLNDDSGVILKAQLNDGKKVNNKIYLSGSCYVLGEVDGGLKKRLKKLIEGDFIINTSSASTKYQVDFYYINLETGEKTPIMNNEGKPYYRIINEYQTIGDPYDPSYGVNGEYIAPDFYEGDGTIVTANYVPEYPDVNGYSYYHTPQQGQHQWMVKPTGEPAPTLEELKAEPNVLTSKKVDESLEVYAVYGKAINSYKVYIKNKGNDVTGFEGYTLVPYGSSLYDAWDSNPDTYGKRLPETLPYPGENGHLYDFSRWAPSPESPILGDTVIQATYNFTAYQTVTLLNKTIEEVLITSDKIPDYRFYGCEKLQKVFLQHPYNNIIKLGDSSEANAQSIFADSMIYSNSEISNGKPSADRRTPGSIYVANQELLNRYIKEPGWKEYSQSFKIGKRGEV